eukprot:GHVT01061280.1.p2 GENE.GHVT01061280.1~~GHVT01061280.1.p2  ORF type:complete len:330 (+),score=77.14 GHVT01061280.1:622-1611(+)
MVLRGGHLLGRAMGLRIFRPMAGAAGALMQRRCVARSALARGLGRGVGCEAPADLKWILAARPRPGEPQGSGRRSEPPSLALHHHTLGPRTALPLLRRKEMHCPLGGVRALSSRAWKGASPFLQLQLNHYAAMNPEAFWREQAEKIHWFQPYRTLLDASDPNFPKWFQGGMVNACYSCVDAHVAAGRGEEPALYYDSPVTHTRETISFRGLLEQVERVAGAMQRLNVGVGDRVMIYMPMTVEAVVTMLASARLGAVHCVIFGGFGLRELAVRLDAAKPSLVVAASCGFEPGKCVEYLPALQGALREATHRPAHVVVLNRKQPADFWSAV